jgi:hypothetical protein
MNRSTRKETTMTQENMAYWVNGANGEWGTVDVATAGKLGKRKGFFRTSGKEGAKGWVHSFMTAIKKDGTFLLVENKEEFRYLYRCFENLSMPLAYCPLAPRSNQVNSAVPGAPSRLAA